VKIIRKYHNQYSRKTVICQIDKIVDWEMFQNDERTKNVNFYMSNNAPSEHEIDKSKINILWNMENPGTWFGAKSANHNINAEKYMDYMACYCFQTYHGRKDSSLGAVYVKCPQPYDFNFVRKNILNSGIDISTIEKDKDVFLCGGTLGMKPTYAVTPWAKTMMENFNFTLCSHDTPGFKIDSWEEKMVESLRSKVSIVWTGFFHGMWHPAHNSRKEYTNKNHKFIKFEKMGEGQAIHDMTPHLAYRILDAAFSKSIMLCYKNKFSGVDSPSRQAIENYFTEGEDFIYFNDSQDLKLKLSEILENYEDQKYKNMTESCYNKAFSQFNFNDWYENYIVPAAQRGKIA